MSRLSALAYLAIVTVVVGFVHDHQTAQEPTGRVLATASAEWPPAGALGGLQADTTRSTTTVLHDATVVPIDNLEPQARETRNVEASKPARNLPATPAVPIPSLEDKYGELGTTTTTTVAPTTTPAPPEYLGEGGPEPRYDLPPIPGIENARCGEWWQTALDVGFTVEDLPALDDIMWHESNCLPHVISRTNDYGLVQINWYAHGDRLLAQGIHQEILLDAETNLEQGLWLADYATEHYGCRWQPWKWSGSRC